MGLGLTISPLVARISERVGEIPYSELKQTTRPLIVGGKYLRVINGEDGVLVG
jgi:hypothetical protein